MADQDEPFAPRLPDTERLAANLGRFVEGAGKAGAAWLKPYEDGRAGTRAGEEVAEVVRTLGRVAETWLADPARAVEAQGRLAGGFLELWATTLRAFNGEKVEPVAKPEPGDKRFKDEAWEQYPLFDFVRQAYVLTSRWAEDMVDEAQGLDPHEQHKARFYVRQLSSALSPSNFLPLNPELIRETLAQDGENLARGVAMLAEDIRAGDGSVRIRQSDPSKFALGVNVATTPGKVVLRNDLIELIQYAPSTETVLARPIVIVPPWINKFYILDLNPEKSFIRWAVDRGLTVFCISWVNPDARHRDKGFDDYMREGVLAAVEAALAITGERETAALGYCVGGTLLASSLGYMAATGDDRVSSVTFLTTQVDFSDAGDLAVFVDEPQIKAIEQQMEEKGYLDGQHMAGAFNMLRPNDLIWSNVVNVYMKGRQPLPFDLLFWNSDATRMPAANHKFYLRHCYLQNDLVRGRMELAGVPIDLGRVEIPVYNLAAKEDHIAPAASSFRGCAAFGGEVRYVLAGSGHIAGVVNPPSKPKYGYWTGGAATGTLEGWTAAAEAHPGSWWPDWFAWLEAQAPTRAAPRAPGESASHPALAEAPGTYVTMKA